MKKIFNYLGYFITICAVTATLYGVFKMVYKIENVINKQDDIIQKVDTLSIQVKDLGGQIKELDGQIRAVNENAVLIGNYVEGVKKSFEYHLQRSPEVTKKDYAQMMQIIEELKKNELLSRSTQPF